MWMEKSVEEELSKPSWLKLDVSIVDIVTMLTVIVTVAVGYTTIVQQTHQNTEELRRHLKLIEEMQTSQAAANNKREDQTQILRDGLLRLELSLTQRLTRLETLLEQQVRLDANTRNRSPK